jgi:ABC-type sugar transport system substrate-binding protein
MGKPIRIRRFAALVSVLALAGLLLAAPAAATPRDAHREHKVTICHVTSSASNPCVVIALDVAAFDVSKYRALSALRTSII